MAFVMGTQKWNMATLGTDVGRSATEEFKLETLKPVHLGAGWCQFFLPLLLAGFLCFLQSFD